MILPLLSVRPARTGELAPDHPAFPHAPAHQRWFARPATLALVILAAYWLCGNSLAAELIPPRPQLRPDHPRILLRPASTPFAVSLTELRALPRDAAAEQMLGQLRSQKSAAAQAMVWLLTGEMAAADRALSVLRTYRYPGEVDTFHVFFTLTQFALAYDWLYPYEGFTPQIRAEVRTQVAPLTRRALQFADDLC